MTSTSLSQSLISISEVTSDVSLELIESAEVTVPLHTDISGDCDSKGNGWECEGDCCDLCMNM